MERVYYSINEASARTAHQMMSFSDYKEGSKTAEYKGYENPSLSATLSSSPAPEPPLLRCPTS